MMKFIASFCLFLLAAYYASADSSGNRQCPGGYSDGSQMEMGKYWYECRDAQMIPKGCVSDDGRRVAIDDTFDSKDYRLQCILGSDGYLTVAYKACVFQGSGHDVGTQWDDGTAYYTCTKEGNNVRATMLGCVDQGRPLKFDERVAKGDFIYQCRKSTGGTPEMNKAGCVHEGTKYNIGEAFNGAKAWYTCTDSGPKVSGCVHDSQRLTQNDYITTGETKYSCSVTSSGVEWTPFACMAREDGGAMIERKIGCFWNEGQYEYTCKLDGNNQLVRAPTQCLYHGGSDGTFKIAPGCATVAGTAAVGCVDSGSGNLRIETYSADQIGRLPGLRQC